MRMIISREEALAMEDAHVEGYHTPPDGTPREGCPMCEDKSPYDYPTERQIRERKVASVDG